MTKNVSDILVERLIDWGVDQFLDFRATALTASSKPCAPIKTKSGLFRCVMRRRPHWWQ